MKDRTKEFHQTVTSLLRTLQSNGKNRGSVSPPLSPQPTELTQRALAIQAGIHDLNARINHLTQCNHITSKCLVTTSRSTMEDITPELAEATLAVKQAMAVINRAIQELPTYSKQLYSSQSEHAQAVIKSLQSHYTTSSKLFSNALELLSKVHYG
jgi:paraquat-inducible protein B